MNVTMPSASSIRGLRRQDSKTAQLRAEVKAGGVKLKPRRSPAFEAGATAKLTREARP